MNKKSPSDFVSQLCPNCGLCCNGVLFADVELQKGDDARRLAELGLSLKKKGRKQAFTQPCACFDGTLCRVYPDRPAYCRAFECGLLKAVQAGELKVKTALKTMVEARRRAETVGRLLQQLGQTDQQLALIQRYAQVMREPVELSGPAAAVELRGELMRAVESLMETLQRDFLQ
ncbi:MAG: YkgJ family cysteine cluster protein [Verrucomicrobiia bacterium]